MSLFSKNVNRRQVGTQKSPKFGQRSLRMTPYRFLLGLLIHIGAMLGNRPPNKNPWHAPGTAPIASPCGRFGGNPHGCRGGPPIEKQVFRPKY